MLVAILAAFPAFAQEGEPKLPVPRFVSLRAGKVNVRTGPGLKYPVEWVYTRKGLPVEIVAEYEAWRKLRDWDGAEGWVHQSMLSGRRSVMILGASRAIRKDPGAESRIVARLDPGVMAELVACRETWCEVSVSGYEGWLERNGLFGVYPDEKIED
ncbi:MAG TPA: hypothetical protein DCW68_03340 [Rhodospirillaceae bacterium]|nr:hypothetical protein [Rhodospirillaceae bacterium]